MPVLNITVSLSEVLEVRDAPLTDPEIWALLCQASEALQDINLAGNASSENGFTFVINPDTIFLTLEGQVEFGEAQKVQQYANYMAPETEDDFVFTDTSVEQVYIFALGKSLIYSSEYGLKPDEQSSGNHASMKMSKPVRISEDLESLLRSMTHRNPSQRIPLHNVMEACNRKKECRTRGLDRSFSRTVTNLYQTVLGLEGQSNETLEHQTYSNITSRQNVSPRELTVDRSRRKEKKSRHRRKKDSSPEYYRSRSRSKSRSRSRSHSKHKSHGRRADSPDSGVHRVTPLPRRSGSESYSREDHPYHLSDITFNASQNGHKNHRQLSSSSSSSHHSRPSNRSGTSSRTIDNPAFKKYLRLKERQRKLRVLRHDAMSDDASDELSDIVMDHMSETRSTRSLGSQNIGVYHPEVHMRYGSNSALKIGRDSDRESIISSDASTYGQEYQAFRATADISDPYIQQLQKLSASKPHTLPKFDNKQPSPTKQRKKAPSPRQQKPRDFYGPECIHRSTKPIQRIPLSLQGESRKHPGHVCRVIVVLLNGQKMEAMVDPSMTGQQLYEAVVTEIELPEFYFFGLTYVNDNEHFFISSDTKLHKVAPDGWKESWKREAAPVTFTLYLRVKFYVEHLAALKHETSRHQLYLQLRRDMLEERCLCDEDKAMNLAALAMQAEYGDYHKENMGRNYFVPEHYFSEKVLKRLGSGYVRDHAPDNHKKLAGMSDVEAEMEFIKFFQEHLPEYGIHFHKLLKEKKGKSTGIIWIGINMDNLILAEDANGQRVMVHQYPWSAIQKISFNRRRFSVQPKPNISEIKPFKMNFYTTSYKKGQYLLRFCTTQHSFQLKVKTRLAVHDGLSDLSHTEHMSIGDAEDMGSVHSDDEQTITDDRMSQNLQDVEMERPQFIATDHVPQKNPAAYRNPPPYRPDSSASMIDIPINIRENLNTVHHTPRSATTSHIDEVGQRIEPNPALPEAYVVSEEDIDTETVEPARAYVIDTSTHSVDQTLFPPSGSETISDTLHQRFTDELLSPDQSIFERDAFEVALEKHPTFGIGITIVGGDIAGKRDLGVYVKSVTKDGPAFKDGRIKAGDRLIAINDKNLEGLQHHEAVNMIKESPDYVKLTIFHVLPPGSIKRGENYHEAEAVFQAKLKASMMDKHSHSDEENSSFDQSAEESISHDVKTVQNCASVHNQDNTDHKNKNIQNVEKHEKNVNSELELENIEKQIVVSMDQVKQTSATADVHSTLSQVDSLNSEVAASDIPSDQHNESEHSDESDTDSEYEDVINQVIENTYKPSHSANSQFEKMETFEVFLEKQQGSFGLNVTGGVNTSVRHGGIYVKSIIPESAAANDDTIQKGDRILEVDDTSMEGYTHKQAVEALCNAPPFCKLLIGRLSSALSKADDESAVNPKHYKDTSHEVENQPDDIYSTFVTEDNTYAVDLVKGTYGLGFSTVGGSLAETADIADRVVRIKRVFPIGPASDSGMIHSGDVLLAVNGQSLAGLSHNETMSRLRSAGKHVQLLMCNPDPDQLPPLAPAEGAESLEITPTGSTSNVTDTESDSDSDIDVTPRREALITPPSGFALSPFPKDSDGNILPRVVSPPPPLPISPPPTMLSADSGDDTPREGYEIQVGVAELLDSCTSEMVHINNSKPSTNLEVLNGSLIVREDSAITVNSRDDTPVTLLSTREEAESLHVIDSLSPINDDDNRDDEVDSSYSEQLRVGMVSAESTFVESVPDTSLNIVTDLSPASSCTGLTEDSHCEENSSEDDKTKLKLDSTTSLNADGLVTQSTFSEDINQETLGNSLVNTYTIDDSCAIDNVRNDLDVNVDVENTVHIKDSLNSSVNSYVSIEVASCNVVARSSENSEDNEDVDDVDDDDDVERLKKKYLEMEKQEEEENSDSLTEDESDEDVIDQKSDANESEQNDIDSGSITEKDIVGNIDNDGENLEETEEAYEDHTDSDAEIDEHGDSLHDDENYELNSDDIIKDQEVEDVSDKDENQEELKHEYSDKTEAIENEYGTDEVDNEENKESVSDHSSRRESLSPTMDQPLKAGEFEVTLTKPEGQGLGFTVAGGAKTTGGCYVKAVLQNPALSDGNIKPGDKLIMVNGVDMKPLNHFEAVSVFREADEVVTIRLFREKVPEGNTRQAGVVNLSLSESLTPRSDNEDHQESEDDHDENSDFNKNNEDKSDDEEKSGVAADDTWPLQDLIASLQESLEESKQVNKSPVGARKNAENYWRDKSQREARSPKSPSTNQTEPSVYHIDLQKPKSGGLGISLVTAETQNQTGVFIRTITPGGVAEADGRLRVGDKILQINGESLVGMNHNKAATILRKYQGKLSLTVSRNSRKFPVLFDHDDTGSRPENKDLKLMSNQELSGAENLDVINESDDDSEQLNNSTLNDTSLSLTKHLPSDIIDEDVEQLVADAERILKDANDEFSEDTDVDTEKLGSMEKSHKKLVKHSHKYLSATEVIDYQPDQIRLETDEDTAEDDIFGEDSEGAKELDDNSCDTSAVEYDCDKSWSDLLRTLDVTVPDEVTNEWLYELSLVTVPEDMKPAIPNIIAKMQEKIEIEDPQEEFKQLRNVPLTDECDTAMTPNNRLKNRFRNVLPYDENRVKLVGGDTDYINASHVRVDVGTSVCDYIVCQGPLPETTDAFWQMIWQENVSVIVMLTLDVEAMKVKCHRYWPDSVDVPLDVCNGKWRVSLLYQNCLDDFDIRNILLENNDTGETRCLYHLNYTTWPDHGTPTSALPLLQCLRLSHLYRSIGPIVVHCSAGIGRSGTFVTVDIVLAHIERGLEFDIFEIVKQLRRQRQGMIQTRDQYTFCYTACVEALLDTPS